jgi:predicted Zn-ribbon and HTH transcriptional regulator
MTKQTIKQKAQAAGHVLERWKTRRSQATGEVLYANANCIRCGAAFFDNQINNFDKCVKTA